MGLEFDRLPPESLASAIQTVAEQHSEITGETWEALPDTEIPLKACADLLQMANDSYWSNYEKSFELDVDVAKERNIDITLAMRRARTRKNHTPESRVVQNSAGGISP